MTKEEAIELLKNAVPQDESLDEEGLFIEAVNMAIKALEKAETNCPEIPDSWIPVTKKMPEDAEDVPAIPLDWIRSYIDRLKAMGVVISIRDAQAVSVMVDKWAMEQNGNETCGPDYCEIGGEHND